MNHYWHTQGVQQEIANKQEVQLLTIQAPIQSPAKNQSQEQNKKYNHHVTQTRSKGSGLGLHRAPAPLGGGGAPAEAGQLSISVHSAALSVLTACVRVWLYSVYSIGRDE